MRRRVASDDSFELLLDTMTNAFGGVLFISLLVCLQLRNHQGVSVTPDFDREIARLEREKSALETSNARLENSQKSVGQFIERLDLKGAVAVAKQLQELRTEKKTVEGKITVLKGDASKLKRDEETSVAEIERLTAELSDKQQKLQDAQLLLAVEKEKRTVSGRLPVRRRTSKSSVAIAVKYSCYYGIGSGYSINFEGFDGSRLTGITPKPGRGRRILNTDTFENEFEAAVSIRPATQYVSLFVWEDSFDEFQTLKDILVSRGIEYRLVLMRASGRIGFGGSGSAYTQ